MKITKIYLMFHSLKNFLKKEKKHNLFIIFVSKLETQHIAMVNIKLDFQPPNSLFLEIVDSFDCYFPSMLRRFSTMPYVHKASFHTE